MLSRALRALRAREGVDLGPRFVRVSEGSAWLVGALALALMVTLWTNLVPTIGMAGPTSQRTLISALLASASLLLFHRGRGAAGRRAGAALGLLAAVPGILVLASAARVGH